VASGQRGCVRSVRRWGVQCYSRILQDAGFDPSRYLSGDRQRFPGGDDEEIVYIVIHATHFDLPAYFVIASQQHPLLLFDPQGLLKGYYTRGHTHVGALAYLVSGGKVTGSFGVMYAEQPALYREALGYLLKALQNLQAE